MKRRPISERDEDLKRLLAAGLKVACFSPVHWRVKKPGWRGSVDVWPSTGKFWSVDMKGAQFYRDVVKEVEARFEPIRKPSKDETQAKEQAQELRSGGLAFIQSRVNRGVDNAIDGELRCYD